MSEVPLQDLPVRGWERGPPPGRSKHQVLTKLHLQLETPNHTRVVFGVSGLPFRGWY